LYVGSRMVCGGDYLVEVGRGLGAELFSPSIVGTGRIAQKLICAAVGKSPSHVGGNESRGGVCPPRLDYNERI
ncbi:MAG: hypothetical protein K2L00_04345, partial [Muribaculaceae bacterium]|nr:hypothetical protein [Muribaculaceae bacterium]